MENVFIHIGMGTVANRARVLFIAPPGNTTARRYVEEARKVKPAKYHNGTLGHKQRSIVVMDDGTVLMSAITPKTLMKRMNATDVMPDEDEDFGESEEEEEGCETEGDPE